MKDKRFLNRLAWILGSIALVFIVLASLFYWRVIYNTPILPESDIKKEDLVIVAKDHFILNNNWLKKNTDGNWECYVEGSAYDRGRTLGILQGALIESKEDAFISEIDRQVPSKFIRNVLLVGISWFNRDLNSSISEEMIHEIYGVSEFFSDKYDWIGPKFNRILNYHAAHDIGHAVQNMHLVGCTAFGEWSKNDTTQEMLFGRTFDFYFGDDFAKDKIVLFCKPDKGYSYMSVTWAGFCGVVSGMNEAGLGITLNSDKSEIPSKSATPVSLIAREILQYAQSINEAIEIANKYTSFVSESFTISSAYDQKIMVIEKTPEETGYYYPAQNKIIVSNHFQSDELKHIPINREHIETSESLKRFMRVKELLSDSTIYNESWYLRILRDKKGLNNTDIGMGNPMAIDQLLAHHAVIFKPVERLVWVSNYPYQSGNFNAYDLNQVSQWTAPDVEFPISIDSLELPIDPFIESKEFSSFELYKSMRQLIISATDAEVLLDDDQIEKFVNSNRNYYETYRVVGLYYYNHNEFEKAIQNFEIALSKEIPYAEDKTSITELLKELKNK